MYVSAVCVCCLVIIIFWGGGGEGLGRGGARVSGTARILHDTGRCGAEGGEGVTFTFWNIYLSTGHTLPFARPWCLLVGCQAQKNQEVRCPWHAGVAKCSFVPWCVCVFGGGGGGSDLITQ